MVFLERRKYYYCTFKVPELTSTIYNYGVVSCYREYNRGTNDAYQLPLPQTIHNVDAGNGALYTSTIDFSFAVGLVEIVLTNNDFAYDAPEAFQLPVRTYDRNLVIWIEMLFPLWYIQAFFSTGD